MSQMVPFDYVEYYDVPRNIVLRHQGRVLLLQSAFDEQSDEYASEYSVYLATPAIEDMAKSGQWDFLATASLNLIGLVRVQDVVFDPTHRRALDTLVLDPVLDTNGTATQAKAPVSPG